MALRRNALEEPAPGRFVAAPRETGHRGAVNRPAARLALFAALLACAFAQHADAAPLRWGADAEGGAPFVFADPKEPSKRVGFEVEVAAALGRALGEELAFVQYDFRALPEGLERGDLDLAMNGLEVTPERAARVRFSRPYYAYTQQLVVRADEARFDGIDGCAAANGLVGTLELTGSERYLRERSMRAKLYDGQVEPYVDLELGRLDAVLFDLPVAAYYAKANPKLRYAGAPFAPGTYAVAVARGNEALAARVDRAIEAISRSGELQAIYARWGIGNAETASLLAGATSAEASSAPAATVKPAAPTVAPASAPGADGTLLEASHAWTPRVYLPLLLESAWVTVALAVVSMIGAVLLGLPIALARLYAPRPVQLLAGAYVELFRGVPILLILYFLYYGLPVVASGAGLPFALRLGPLDAAALGFVLNYAAYEAEVQRAGLASVSQGQWEGAASLGLTRRQTFRHVVAPQALRVALPAMTNDFIALFKDTSVVSVIAVVELSKQYQILSKSSLKYLEIGLLTAALYLAFSVPFGVVARRLEQRWGSRR